MSELIEKVAAAISDQRQKHRYGSVMTPWGDNAMADSFRREQLELSRAAIAAMREPTAKMLEAGDSIVAEGVWRDMIDAALNAEDR